MLRNFQSVGVANFLQTLRIFGSLWFLTFPVLVLIASFCHPSFRHLLITAGSIGLQCSALSVLFYLFLSRSSQYWKISSLSQMGTITGNIDESMNFGSSTTNSNFRLQQNYDEQGISSRRRYDQRSQQAYATSPNNFTQNTNNNMRHSGNINNGTGGRGMSGAARGWGSTSLGGRRLRRK